MSDATENIDHPGYPDHQRAPGPRARRPFVAEPEARVHAGPIHLVTAAPPAGAVVDPAVPEYGAHLLLRTAPLLRVGFNRRPRWLAVSPGAMVVTPPDTDCEFVADAPAHVVTVAVPKGEVEAYAEASGTAIAVHHERAFRDPHLERQILRLWRAIEEEAPGTALLGDSVMRALLASWARQPAGSSPGAAREVLANHVLRRLADYVENGLADELDVPLLARVAGLSPAHFARAFVATVGVTPFRYVMARRLARARDLLETTRRPALEVALDVGFKTPSHFSARFRREFGVTPRELRDR